MNSMYHLAHRRVATYVHDTHEHTQLSPECSLKEGFNDRKILLTVCGPMENTLNHPFFTLFILEVLLNILLFKHLNF